ncbi:MAG TPA: sensor histidine kinase [Thermoanaerobaculia bacterium]
MTAHAATAIRPDYTPHARAERLIAAGRFVLAFSSLVAIYLEPSTPARFQRATYALLSVYTVYALAIVIVAWRLPVPRARWRLFSHALDLVLFSVFVYLTEGPASPFFLYFVFSLFCATLRFSARGILATGVAAIGIYGAMAVVASLGDPGFEISRVLIREAYLGVIAALLVYLGAFHQRVRREMSALAAWPRELGGNVEVLLQATLAHAASVMNAPRVMLVWEESEEPWTYVARLTDGRLDMERVPPGAFESLSAAGFRNTSYYARGGGQPLLVYDPALSSAAETTASDPIGSALRTRYAIGSAIVVTLESETVLTRFIIPDVGTATADDLELAHIAGRLVLATLEQCFFVQQVRQTASAEERLRISRELHDGIVQSLGGVGLQLEAIRAQFAKNPAAEERLRHVQQVVEHDQQELRAILRELRPHDPRDGRTILTHELQRMRERYALEWGLEVTLDARAAADMPPRLAHELCRLVNESLANAAKHGGATRAEIGLTADAGRIQVRIADNGRGFAFEGRYDLDALDRGASGPRSLKERIRALDGTLVVESSPGGATIEAAIPVREEASW